MITKYITDLDFVPTEYLRYHGGLYSNTLVKDYYQILYGILRENIMLDDVYDIVVRMSKKEPAGVVKRFKLMEWRKTNETIIRNLNKSNLKDCNVVVRIPFTNYEEDIATTINYFQLVTFTIDEILEKGDKELEVAETPNYEFPVKDMKQLMADYCDNYVITLREKGYIREWVTKEDGSKELYDELGYWVDILLDEMYRRGITHFGEGKGARPSKYFSEPHRYKEAFIEKGKELEISEIENDDEPGKPIDTNNSKIKVAVMYYLLNNIAAIKQYNQHEAIALINYAIGKPYNVNAPKRETNSNTVKRYLTKYRNNGLKEEKQEFIDAVRAKLAEYGFKLPDEE